MKDDDIHLFRESMGDVKPLKSREKTVPAAPVEETPGMRMRRLAAEDGNDRPLDYLAPADQVKMVGPRDELSFKRDGVQHGVFKNLRLGKYSIDSRLDLHGMKAEFARRKVLEFVRDCVAHNVRCVLISHGRGENRETPALLKSCVNHWLQQMDEVLAFHSAQRFHGGFGATYVLLRKSDEKREENRERYSKRGG